MDETVVIFRLTHVLVGFLGLAAFWVPVLSMKGGVVHRSGGRVFALCALYVGGTGLALSVWAIADPPSFFGDPEAKQIVPEDVPAAIANTRFLYSITGFLGIMILSATVLGWRVARTSRYPERLSRTGLHAMLGVYALWSVGLIVFGVWNLIASQTGEHPVRGSGGRYWVSAVIGAIGLWGAKEDVAYVRRAPTERGCWRSKHIECMLGAGIGFHAAALFFGVNGLLGLELEGAMRFVPLIVPFLVGMPVVWWAVARQERTPTHPGQ